MMLDKVKNAKSKRGGFDHDGGGILSQVQNVKTTKNNVYETLCPKPFAFVASVL